ncbi:uncharacterized protein LOC107266961 isoform X2 [Cephus cinctus]|uniref:Uncharacterized protein LOC107266961 isoform X2 n=1 Tax=Cephus cinctus TaxID=211228 RepID=A0AAJ7RF02_CEPCN|nr:uncharacterized protein LOC107266961 isoform X2 [Cephus cinctus]
MQNFVRHPGVHFQPSTVMSGYKWVRYTGGRYTTPGMISVGRDKDGSNLVVGRAYHQGDLLPAKVKPEHGVAYISHNMQEIIKHDFEILMPLEFTWVNARNGQIPAGAVPGGYTRSGEQLYIGKVFHDGVPVVGKTRETV